MDRPVTIFLCVLSFIAFVSLMTDKRPQQSCDTQNAPELQTIDDSVSSSDKTLVSLLVELEDYDKVEPSDSTAYSIMLDFGVQHPHLALAQMKIESGNYSSNIAKKNNNYFGMRQPGSRMTVSLGAKNGYAKYRNWAYSILDYALWQRRYAWDLTEEEYLTKLSKVYAEDPNYASKVKKLSKNLENKK